MRLNGAQSRTDRSEPGWRRSGQGLTQACLVAMQAAMATVNDAIGREGLPHKAAHEGRGGLLRPSRHAVQPYLKMQLIGRNGEAMPGDFYGKVVGNPTEPCPGFTVHFTAIPPQLMVLLQQRLAG